MSGHIKRGAAELSLKAPGQETGVGGYFVRRYRDPPEVLLMVEKYRDGLEKLAKILLEKERIEEELKNLTEETGYRETVDALNS